LKLSCTSVPFVETLDVPGGLECYISPVLINILNNVKLISTFNNISFSGVKAQAIFR